jgi:hypothetical protein
MALTSGLPVIVRFPVHLHDKHFVLCPHRLLCSPGICCGVRAIRVPPASSL